MHHEVWEAMFLKASFSFNTHVPEHNVFGCKPFLPAGQLQPFYKNKSGRIHGQMVHYNLGHKFLTMSYRLAYYPMQKAINIFLWFMSRKWLEEDIKSGSVWMEELQIIYFSNFIILFQNFLLWTNYFKLEKNVVEGDMKHICFSSKQSDSWIRSKPLTGLEENSNGKDHYESTQDKLLHLPK